MITTVTETEIWSPVKNVKELFISNLGRYRQIKLRRVNKYYNKQLKTYAMRISLSLKGKDTTVYVSRLVAEAFVPNPDPKTKTQVIHLNFDRMDNRYTNLEWCSGKENLLHAWWLKRVCTSKLTYKKMQELCSDSRQLTIYQLAEKYKVPIDIVLRTLSHAERILAVIPVIIDHEKINMPFEEEWRGIKNYPNLEVSNKGRVRINKILTRKPYYLFYKKHKHKHEQCTLH